jgi:hypothetical protein
MVQSRMPSKALDGVSGHLRTDNIRVPRPCVVPYLGTEAGYAMHIFTHERYVLVRLKNKLEA